MKKEQLSGSNAEKNKCPALIIPNFYFVAATRLTGATGILLFYNYLPDKLLNIKPNK